VPPGGKLACWNYVRPLPKFQRAAGEPDRPSGDSKAFNRKAATLATRLTERDWRKCTKIGRVFVAQSVPHGFIADRNALANCAYPINITIARRASEMVARVERSETRGAAF
jgi:hypothetical protein